MKGQKSALILGHGQAKCIGPVQTFDSGRPFLVLIKLEVGRHLIVGDAGATAEATAAQKPQSGRILVGDLGDKMAHTLAAKQGKGKAQKFLCYAATALVRVDDQMVNLPAIF